MIFRKSPLAANAPRLVLDVHRKRRASPVWLFAGPFFNYSDTWQLMVNTATTVITSQSLIQNTRTATPRRFT